jgi:uncharacterized membrane protein
MNLQTGQVWATLLEAGLVQGEAPPADTLESPWYVKVLLAFSGWLAALFLLGFVGAGFYFIFESGSASFITGALMIGGAYAILRMPRNEFLEHLTLAVSLAGQALVVLAIVDLTESDEASAWFLVALLQVSLAGLMPNYVHRVFSSFIATFAFSMSLSSMGAPYLFSGVTLFLAAWLWLNEFRYPRHIKKIQAIAYGLVLALVPLKGSALFGHVMLDWASDYNKPGILLQPWIGEVLTSVVTLYVVWQLLRRHAQAISTRYAIMSLLGTLLICAASVEAPGITVGMVILLLGFAGANRVLLGLGIVSLLFYVSSYYYLLDTTLLAKSQALLIVGLALFAVRWLMLRAIDSGQEVNHG